MMAASMAAEVGSDLTRVWGHRPSAATWSNPSSREVVPSPRDKHYPDQRPLPVAARLPTQQEQRFKCNRDLRRWAGPTRKRSQNIADANVWEGAAELLPLPLHLAGQRVEAESSGLFGVTTLRSGQESRFLLP